MPADRATCEADIPGSKDAATSCSFSDRDHRRRRSTGRTSDRAIVITKLLELLLGLSRSDLPNKAVPGVCVRSHLRTTLYTLFTLVGIAGEDDPDAPQPATCLTR